MRGEGGSNKPMPLLYVVGEEVVPASISLFGSLLVRTQRCASVVVTTHRTSLQSRDTGSLPPQQLLYLKHIQFLMVS
jgi:hypothetical protein